MDVESGFGVVVDLIENGTDGRMPDAPALALEGTTLSHDADGVSPDRGSHVVLPAVFGRPEQSVAISNVDLPAACAVAGPSMMATMPGQQPNCKGQLTPDCLHGHSQVVPTAPTVDTVPSKTACVAVQGTHSAETKALYRGVVGQRPSVAVHANVIAMTQGLLHKRVYWYGDFQSDLWFFIKQNHVILGILLCHQLHPYSRRERLAVWLCCGCASFALGLLLLRSTGEKRDGASIVSLFNGCILTVLHMSLKMLATCPCVQDGSFAHFDSCQWYCEECGCVLMACIWCHVWIMLGVCIAFAFWVGVPMDHAFQVWAQSQLVAFAFGIVICTVIFCLKWYGLKKGALARLFPGQGGPEGVRPKCAFPFGPALPSDPHIFPGGDRCACSKRNLPMPKPDSEVERE